MKSTPLPASRGRRPKGASQVSPPTSMAKPWKLTPKQRAAAGYCAHGLVVHRPELPEHEAPFAEHEITYLRVQVNCTKRGKHAEHSNHRLGHTWA